MKLKTDKSDHKEFSTTKALVVSTAFQHQYAESPAFIESRDPFYVPSMTAGGGEPSPGFFHPETAHRPHQESDNIFELTGDEDEKMIIGGGLGVLFLLGIFALFSWSRNAHLSAPQYNPAALSQHLPNIDTIGKGASALALGFLGIQGARSALKAGYNTGFGDVNATANRSVISSLTGSLNQNDSDILAHSLQGKVYPWQWSDLFSPLNPYISAGTDYVIEQGPEIKASAFELASGAWSTGTGALFSGVSLAQPWVSTVGGFLSYFFGLQDTGESSPYADPALFYNKAWNRISGYLFGHDNPKFEKKTPPPYTKFENPYTNFGKCSK